MSNQPVRSLPSGWRWTSLGTLGKWSGGGTPSKANANFWKGKIPWVSPKDMKCERISDAEDHITRDAIEGSATNLVPAGSVLVVTRSGILERTLPVAVTDVDVTINQDLKALTPRVGVDPSYVAYALRAFEREILHECSKSGTTVASIEFPKFHSFPIPVAPLADQGRIVTEIEKQLTRLDAGVAVLDALQAHLRRYRAAVLKAACDGRLVPLEARLAHAHAHAFHSGEAALLAALDARREAHRASGKKRQYVEPSPPAAAPPLPDGWAWASVEQLTPADRACAYGVLQPGPDLRDGVPLVRVGDIDEGRIAVAGLKRIAQSIAAEYSRTCLRGGELLITLVGSIGRTAVVPPELAGANTARAVGVVPLTSYVDARWVELWFRNPEAIARLQGQAHEVARKTLNLEDVRRATVAFPPLPEQHRIVSEVERRFSVANAVDAAVSVALQRAAALRASILRAAFDGRLVAPEQPARAPAA